MDFVSAVSEVIALSIPSSLRPTAEISCGMRSIVAPCTGSAMVLGRVIGCTSEAGKGALECCRASEKSNFQDDLPECLPDILPPGIADSLMRVCSGRL
ncbi:hypothetical protein NDU88_001913 [Pleurodeles waltl]|uniref:Uncharacterized protein n=1 Tax=Pleurodeles waltl TaxID=8319 RepID=A0AAV7T0K0_PLEWA|nr:hypothetical protein NDU88_001913 [Pleurodeles waltl]